MFENTHLKLDVKIDREELKLLAKVLKSYVAEGKTKEDFEEEYGCTLILDDCQHGIAGVKFQNDSFKTAYMLKYSNK